MNQRRIIFFSIFGVYHLAAFIFTLMMESNTSFLFQLVSYVKWFKYGTFLGVLLVVADFVWWWREERLHAKAADAQRLENNTLKAKVYDLQQAAKAPTVSK
jgi:hypothetical protein